MRFDPDKLPLSADEIEAQRILAKKQRVEAIRQAREIGLRGDDAKALEVHKGWKPIAADR